MDDSAALAGASSGLLYGRIRFWAEVDHYCVCLAQLPVPKQSEYSRLENYGHGRVATK